jgi:hypothetical protein
MRAMQADARLLNFARNLDPFLIEHFGATPEGLRKLERRRSRRPGYYCIPRARRGRPCIYVVGTIETEIVGGPGPDIDYYFRECRDAPVFKDKTAAAAWSRKHEDTVVGSREVK